MSEKLKPIMTALRKHLLEIAAKSGGLAAPFLSRSEERAAFAMTQMHEPLLLPAHWGPFDYVITEAGRLALKTGAQQ